MKGGLLATIDHKGKFLQIFSPISGSITGFNTLLQDEASALHEDPFRTGWICQIRPSDWVNETKSYFLATEATKWMEKEVIRFKDFVMISLGKNQVESSGIILQDGGELREDTLAEMPENMWKDFQQDFLNTTN
jgi:glycine cleavage system H protein